MVATKYYMTMYGRLSPNQAKLRQAYNAIFCFSVPTKLSQSGVGYRTQRGQIKAVGGSNVAMPHKNTIELNEVNSQSQWLQNAFVWFWVIFVTDTVDTIC